MPDLLRRTAIAVVAAVLVNIAVRALAKALFDIPDSFEHIALRAVVVSTLVGVVAAALVYALIRRDRTFMIVAAVALVLSLAAPLSVDGETAAVGTLMSMHVTTAAIVVAVLTSGRRRGT